MSTLMGASGDDTESAGSVRTPLFGNQNLNRTPSLHGAAQFLHRASSRHMLREPSMRVREATAEQIEERQINWANSKPIVVLDMIWNVALVVVSFSILVLSREEKAVARLRWWLGGYAIQCLLHMVCVSTEYRKRRRQRHQGAAAEDGGGDDDDDEEIPDHSSSSVAEKLKSLNSAASIFWWIIGFNWVSAVNPDDAPQLYWLCVILLASEVFILVGCVAVACVIGIAICCCLPCIISILYALKNQEGAKKEDIEKLPRFKFRKQNAENIDQESFVGGKVTECDTDSPMEYLIPLEDAECSICLSSYDDGAELRELPCRHHFHSGCVDKWLCINATCPLCKLNILRIGGGEA